MSIRVKIKQQNDSSELSPFYKSQQKDVNQNNSHFTVKTTSAFSNYGLFKILKILDNTGKWGSIL